MHVVLGDILVIHEGATDFTFIGKTKEQDKSLAKIQIGDTFEFDKLPYEIENIFPLLEEKNYYPYSVRVKV